MGLEILITMAYLLENTNADNIWSKALSLLLEHGERVKNTIEISQVTMCIQNPRQKWVSVRKPPLSIAFALVEVIWILSGSNCRDIIDFWNPAYKKFAADNYSSTYYGAYGYRLRNYRGVDQLDRAYCALKSNPNNRQTVLLYWDPLLDMPKQNGERQSNDIPCNICSMLKIRDSKLEWTQIMRSNDIYKGLPYNFVQFTSLQEILAGWLGIEVGSYTHFSDSLHLYDEDKICSANEHSNVVNTDTLSLPKDESTKIIKEIYSRLEYIAHNSPSFSELRTIAILNSKYVAYNNILLIACAYVANKFKYVELTNELLSICKNQLYVDMMQAFIHKKNNDKK